MSRPCSGLIWAAVLLVFVAGCDDGAPKEPPPVVDTSPPPVDAEGTRLGTPGAPPAVPMPAEAAEPRPEPDEDPPPNKALLMTAAVAEARATVHQFIDALTSPQATQSGFSVKIPVHDGDLVEHFWVLAVRFEDGQFVGQIGGDPESVSSVKNGDEIRALPNEIDDWMYLDDRRLVGGYTIRAQRKLMSADERREFEQSLPYIID